MARGFVFQQLSIYFVCSHHTHMYIQLFDYYSVEKRIWWWAGIEHGERERVTEMDDSKKWGMGEYSRCYAYRSMGSRYRTQITCVYACVHVHVFVLVLVPLSKQNTHICIIEASLFSRIGRPRTLESITYFVWNIFFSLIRAFTHSHSLCFSHFAYECDLFETGFERNAHLYYMPFFDFHSAFSFRSVQNHSHR